MRKLFFIYFFTFCFALPVVAVASTIIPPVIVKPKKENRSFTGGPKTIITAQQITNTGVATLAQALQNLGGLQLQDTSGNGSQVLLSMRGFGANASSNTLMLINGIPLTNPDLAPPDLNSIPASEIQLIEIVTGSESVLYGDQAVGGIVNIVTKKEKQEKWALSCSAGSYYYRNCYGTLNNNYRELNYNVTLLTNHTDNYRNHNIYYQNLLFGLFDYPYSTGRLSFDYKLANEYMQYPGALTAAQVRQNRRQATNDTDFFKDWNTFLHLKSKQQLNENWSAEIDLARRRMQGNGVLMLPFTQNRTVDYFKPQIKGTLHTQYFNNTNIVGGLDLQNDNYHLGSPFFLTNNTQQKYGLFGLANIPVNERLALSVGARGAQQNSQLESATDSNTINRALATTLAVTYKLHPDAQFYLRRAGSFRFPKADENAFVPNGVTALRTQRGVSYETGIEIEQDKYSGKLGLYQLNLRDEIAFDPTQTPQTPFGSNQNLSPTIRQGLTLSGKNQLTNKITLDGQYNYVKARFQNGMNAGNRIPLVSENIVRAGLNYEFLPHWHAYTEALYTGSQFAANDYANIAGAVGGYTIYNFNLHYAYQGLIASLRINNIFDKNYYFYTVYQAPAEFFYPAPGRNFMLTIKYAFM